MKTDNATLFERMPVPKAVITLIVPTVISQVITVIYNMADTFFIGQMNDPNQVAASTLIMPPFIMLTGIANLFGIGGSSLLSRSLGVGDRVKASKCASFSIWASVAAACLYSVFFNVFRSMIFPFLGADAQTFRFCADYAFWTIGIGGIPTVLSACLAHLVRGEGYAKEASFGVIFGCVLNMVLDPLLMFGAGLGFIGAAVATMLSNVVATVYFIFLLRKNKDKTVIKFSAGFYTELRGIPKEILLVGFPVFVMNLMSIVSNTILNKLVVSYSNNAIAGMGIAKKIDMLAFAVASGMAQGVLPLIGYNYAAKNMSRMRAVIKTSFLCSFVVAVGGAVLLFTCAVPIVRLFMDDTETVAYGQHFLRIICLTCPAISITMMVITIFQATGQKIKPMILSMLRKGCLDVPFMFVLNAAAGATGIPWATPIADVLAMTASVIFFLSYRKQLGSNTDNSSEK